MFKYSISALFLVCAVLSKLSYAEQQPANAGTCAAWLNHKVGKLHSSKQIDLCEATQGKVVLIVNTASHCGYTYQFKNLENLYQTYKARDFVIVGVPSNDFNQEAKSEAKTADVCYKNYGVTFLMTKKQHVKGSQAHPVFQHLKAETQSPNWNFNKYLINKKGQVVKYYPSGVKPDSQAFMADIEKWL